jgi:ABC-type uncharacterized transport system fused permease/ATPase subunit
MMFRALLASPQRNRILLLGIALITVIGATAFAQIKLNAWNQPFYDALSRKDLGAFFSQLVVFVYIACGLLILKVAETWFSQKMKLKLRDGLVRDLFDQWLKPGRAFRLTNAGPIGTNPDQRIHEDAPAFKRAHRRSGARAPPVVAPALQFYWRPMVSLGERGLPFQREKFRYPRLHGLGRPDLRGHGILA